MPDGDIVTLLLKLPCGCVSEATTVCRVVGLAFVTGADDCVEAIMFKVDMCYPLKLIAVINNYAVTNTQMLRNDVGYECLSYQLTITLLLLL